MSLLLIELAPPTPDRAAVRLLLDRLDHAVRTAGGELIEAQATADAARVFAVARHTDQGSLAEALAADGIEFVDLAPVRLVGAELEALLGARPSGRYLVEWDLPAGLTMDAYLARKREKAPLYAEVPEATFLRTYVREDMAKCLCFYDADDEGAVRKAREAVSAPIDRLHQLADG